MTNGNDAVYSGDETIRPPLELRELHEDDKVWHDGLTKRELFSAMAMQGLVPVVNIHTDIEDAAQTAVEFADALIAALNKE